MKKNTSKGSKDRPIAKSFGHVLQQLRRDRGLSQEELGFASGYHRIYISLLERGHKSPSLRTIFELAKALKVEPSEIVERVQSFVTYHSKNRHKINSV
jgi:transcriptional regulator with XRE-family HTH domain